MRIACDTTPDAPGPADEGDRAAIDAFLAALAEVALAVAARNMARGKNGEETEP